MYHKFVKGVWLGLAGQTICLEYFLSLNQSGAGVGSGASESGTVYKRTSH